MLRKYAPNSPEAIGRIVAMAMITDGEVDPREIDVLDRSKAWATMGLGRKAFAVVARDYLRDQGASTEEDTIRQVDEARIDAILDEVSAADARLRACAVMLNVISADGTAADIERALFSHVLQRWGLTPESLNTGLRRLRKTAPEHAPH